MKPSFLRMHLHTLPVQAFILLHRCDGDDDHRMEYYWGQGSVMAVFTIAQQFPALAPRMASRCAGHAYPEDFEEQSTFRENEECGPSL